MHSCIYEGTVTHRRHEPVDHRFQYRLFMVYLDLDELPAMLAKGGLIGTNKYGLWSFLRSDHLFDHSQPLAQEVQEIVRQQTGQSPRGPIRLLTQLRYCGYYMSPLNLFYIYDEADRNVQHIVAEVSNTPWNERHCYVLWDGNRTSDTDDAQFSNAKEFHVSPFMPMDMNYAWRVSEPTSKLKVHIANSKDSRKAFEATMNLKRQELCTAQLRRMTIRYPLMTAQISAAIYYQALKLWWKQCPFYPHPNTLTKQTFRATESQTLPATTATPAP